MRLDRAGSSGLHVGPLRFGSKTNEKGNEKRDVFQEMLFQRLFFKSEVNGSPMAVFWQARGPDKFYHLDFRSTSARLVVPKRASMVTFMPQRRSTCAKIDQKDLKCLQNHPLGPLRSQIITDF